MSRRVIAVFLAALIFVPIALFGCKGKVEKAAEEPRLEMPEAVSSAGDVLMPREPAQNVAAETIPPTAASQKAIQVPAMPEDQSRDKEIQAALKNAGFYAGAIDGKIGPRTKKAIEEFQKEKGLKVDGKVGPRTWAELEKYLLQQ